MLNDSWVEFLLSNLRCQRYWHSSNQPRPIPQAMERTSFTLGKVGWQDRNPSALVSSNQGLNTTESKNLGFSWNVEGKIMSEISRDWVKSKRQGSENAELLAIWVLLNERNWECSRRTCPSLTTRKSNREVSFHHLINLIKGILKDKISRS